MGPRNPSFGKGLNRLTKLTPAHEVKGDGTASAKHHRRAQSGDSSTSNSPRPAQVKRNQSAITVSRNTSHTALKKNLSHGQLSRNASHKSLMKATKAEPAALKRALSDKSKAPHNPTQNTVRFDIGDEEEQDEGWTEESASQSPTTTRSNTRQNSVQLESGRVTNAALENDPPEAPVAEFQNLNLRRSQSPNPRPQSAPSDSTRHVNGARSYHSSRPPDADAITSRLLQRTASSSRPQLSSVNATGHPDAHDIRSLGVSQTSTLADTPGRELVSRFINGSSSSGTPRDSSFLPHHDPQRRPSADLDARRRNKSAPNFADRSPSSATHSRNLSQRSETSTPTDLRPSRTQQKLWLQRASSNIEPQKLIPAILPRTGGPQLLGAGIIYPATSDGRIDPRLQQHFNQATLEYKVVHRYRNPVTDSLKRLSEIPGAPHPVQTPRPRTGGADGNHGLAQTHRERRDGGAAEEGERERRSLHGEPRRSRVSFDIRTTVAEDDGDVEGRQSFGSEAERERDEAFEICRRLWEMGEVSQG